jgi:hypothetical protein
VNREEDVFSLFLSFFASPSSSRLYFQLLSRVELLFGVEGSHFSLI